MRSRLSTPRCSRRLCPVPGSRRLKTVPGTRSPESATFSSILSSFIQRPRGNDSKRTGGKKCSCSENTYALKMTRGVTGVHSSRSTTSLISPITRHCVIYAFAGGARQSGKYRKNATGIARTAKGKGKEKDGGADRSVRRVFLSACAGRNFGFFLDQFAKDGRNLFEIGGLVQEQISAGGQTFLAILGIRIVSADQDVEVRTISADGAKHVEAAAAGHVQIKNDRIWLHLLDAVYRGGHIARLSHKPGAGDLFEKARQALHDYPGVVSDKDFHIPSFMNNVRQNAEPNDRE